MSRASFDVCFDASKKEVQRGPHFRVDDFSIDICCEVKSNSVSITVRSDRHSCWVDVDLFEAHLIVVPMQKIFSERYPINKMKESYFYIEKSDIPNPNGIFSIRFTLALKSKLREEIQTGNRQFCDFVLVTFLRILSYLLEIILFTLFIQFSHNTHKYDLVSRTSRNIYLNTEITRLTSHFALLMQISYNFF